MLKKLQAKMLELSKRDSTWDETVKKFFDLDDYNPEPSETETLDEFFNILPDVIDCVNKEKINLEEAIALFDNTVCQKQVSSVIKRKNRIFSAYRPLKELAEKDIYKAKCCVDIIWSEYVLRFNPYLSFDEDLPLNEADFKKIAKQIDSFTDNCIDRNLNKSAMLVSLSKEADLPESIKQHIVEKIDTDFDRLKLNNLVARLNRCENTIDELWEKLTKEE